MADTNIGYHRTLPNPLSDSGSGGGFVVIKPADEEYTAYIRQDTKQALTPNMALSIVTSGKWLIYDDSEFADRVYLLQRYDDGNLNFYQTAIYFPAGGTMDTPYGETK